MLLLHLRFPGSDSLKAKRSRLQPLLARLRREFNISAAEVDMHDSWQDSLLACALVNSEANGARAALQRIPAWLEHNWHDAQIVDEKIELL